MKPDERIIVSMTSWWKRIGNVVPVISTILKQTMQPDKILINLCTEDFPHMERDLPQDLLDFIASDDRIELYWFIENYGPWKKHLHALEIAGDDDLIISIDDDHLYPEEFIEKMYVSYLYYGKRFPVTLNKIMLIQYLWCFNGPGTLYRKRDFGNYKMFLTYDVLRYCADDVAITLFLAYNRVLVAPMMFHIIPDNDMLYNDIGAFSDYRAKIKHAESDTIKGGDNLRANTFDALNSAFERSDVMTEEQKVMFKPSFWYFVHDSIWNAKNTYGDNLPLPLKYNTDLYVTDYDRDVLLANVFGVDFASVRADLPRLNKDELVGPGNKVIVTISSWNKRIGNVAGVLKRIVNNTIAPDEIVLNLARPDFGLDKGYSKSFDPTPYWLKENGVIPEDLYQLMKGHREIKIHWYDDSTLKSWKKHLYVMNHYDDNDVIICIDDDIMYKETFIETMLKSYNLYDRRFPVTGCDTNYTGGTFAFHGVFTLYTPGFFKGSEPYLTDNVIHMFPEDNHLGAVLVALGHLILPAIGSKYLVEDYYYNEHDSNFGNGNFNEIWWKAYNEIANESASIIREVNAGSEILDMGWNPPMYSFAYRNTEKFLAEYKGKELKYPFDLVYQSVENHFLNNFGSGTEDTGLYDNICDVVL